MEESNVQKVINGAININMHFPIEIEIPKQKAITPIMDIFVFNNARKKEILGVGQMPIYLY